MYKTMIAAVLATSMLAMNSASAAPRRNGINSAGVGATTSVLSRQARSSYARDVGSARAAGAAHDDWENRSIFYQGPTYIGRY